MFIQTHKNDIVNLDSFTGLVTVPLTNIDPATLIGYEAKPESDGPLYGVQGFIATDNDCDDLIVHNPLLTVFVGTQLECEAAKVIIGKQVQDRAEIVWHNGLKVEIKKAFEKTDIIKQITPYVEVSNREKK